MCKTFILITQEAEKLDAKHLPVFFETPCSHFMMILFLIYAKVDYVIGAHSLIKDPIHSQQQFGKISLNFSFNSCTLLKFYSV